MPKPRIYIIAGSNGAGKTTFATEFLPRYAGTVDFINADMIAKGLSPFEVERAATAAGRIALERFEQLAAANRSFAIETTLSGRAYALRLMSTCPWSTTPRSSIIPATIPVPSLRRPRTR